MRAASTSHGPAPIPLPPGSPQLFEEEDPVSFLPTQVACPSSQPQMVGCTQEWLWFARWVCAACPGASTSQLKSLDFVALISIHLFLPGLPLAWSQPASFPPGLLPHCSLSMVPVVTLVPTPTVCPRARKESFRICTAGFERSCPCLLRPHTSHHSPLLATPWPLISSAEWSFLRPRDFAWALYSSPARRPNFQ